MQVRLEFFGIARSRAGVSQWTIETSDSKFTLGQFLLAAGQQFPVLAAECLAGDRPARGYTVNLNGEQFVFAPDTPLKHGDCLLLLSADAGG